MSDLEKSGEVREGAPLNKKKSKINIFALIVCLLISFVIWCYAKGNAIKDGTESVDTLPPVSESAGEQA